jgi:hypothetical protein
MNIKKLNRISRIIVGYCAITVLIAASIYTTYTILDLFSLRLSKKFILKKNENLHANKIFLVRLKDKENKVTACGYINNIKGTNQKIEAVIFPEFTHKFSKGDTVYYFSNDIMNFIKILPLEMYGPFINSLFSSALNDAGKFLETSRFNDYYKPKIYAGLERAFNKTMSNEDINSKLKTLTGDLKKIAIQALESPQMNGAIKRIASRDAELYLTKSGCIMLKKPYVKEECMGEFFKFFVQDLLNDPVINTGLGEIPPKVLANKNLQEFLKMFPGVLIANLASDRELMGTIKQLLNDPELLKAFSPTLESAKKFTQEEIPKIVYQGKGLNPIVLLFMKETIIYNQRGYWFKFDSTEVPDFLIGNEGILE